MSIDEAYSFVKYCANKSQNGNIKPADFNVLAPIAQMSVLNDRLGNVKKYKPHDPVPPYGFGMNQKTMGELRPLYTQVAITTSSGSGTLPADFLYCDVINIDSGPPNPILTELTRDEFFRAQYSVIKPPTLLYPVFTMYNGFFNILPVFTTAKLSYIRRPLTSRWNYTEVNGAPVYAPTGGVIGDGTSQNFELSDTTHFEICAKILGAAGVNLSQQEIQQYAQLEEAKGS